MILPAVNRHLVDTGERAEQVISQLMVSMVREGQVAVDCEWGANAAHEGASLLQLATRGLVVLVDLLALPTTPVVHKLLADVADLAFASRHVVVLGFDGEANDLPHLRAAWRRRGLVFPARVTRYVDVRVACARAGGWEADYDELRGYGLAECAAKFLGRRLDKSPRDLDWRRRPAGGVAGEGGMRRLVHTPAAIADDQRQRACCRGCLRHQGGRERLEGVVQRG